MKSDLHWSKVGKMPHHGICFPLFSLYSKKSSGIGEFLDLLPLIKWCKGIGFDCIQLLPLSDTGGERSPYYAQTANGLDPIYLSLYELGIDDPLLKNLNQGAIQRDKVLPRKLELLENLFRNTFRDLSQSAPYQTFLKEHPWLPSYAHFKALKDHFGGSHWRQWPPNTAGPQDKVDFYTFLQYHCFRQMEIVRQEATKEKVFLFGDVPILLSPDSADVWAHPSFFLFEHTAGSPPDAYNREGQNWGFPLFNWPELKKEGYQWWKQRLRTAEKLYHLYRIDHVVGFFRIWAIEKGKKAAEGIFFPSDRSLWKNQGKEILEMMLDATDILPIAEDLGTIPEEVYQTLEQLGICGMKVVRWQKRGENFIPFDQYPPLSLTTLSTLDLDLLNYWWKNNPSEAVPFANFMKWTYHPILSQKQRKEILYQAHHTPSFFHINPFQEYLALFPELVWPDLETEKLNRPGTTDPRNWTYRFRKSLEEMVSHQQLAEAMKELSIGLQ